MGSGNIIHELNIGGVAVPRNIILAPLAGVADSAFRTVCMEYGAGMCVSEMISAKGVHYGSRGSVALAEHSAVESPFAVQIFGHEPEIMAEAAKFFATEYGADIIDINMGCPVPKVCGNFEGSYLMTQPELVAKIVRAVADAAGVPVTVKMRRGFSQGDENAPEIAKICEANGCAAVAVHGRFRSEYYSGSCDRGAIARVKEAVSVPVIASGDVTTREDAERMFAETGCDGIMIGRGALGNPWVFREIITGEKTDVTGELIRATALRQLELSVMEKGEATAVREIKKHVAWYLKGRKNAAVLKNAAFAASDVGGIKAVLAEL